MSYDSDLLKDKQKPTVKMILKKYRQLGLPNAKKFRKKTRIAKLNEKINVLEELLKQAAGIHARSLDTIRSLISESNFAVHEDGVIEWVADDQSLEQARKYLRDFTSTTPPPPHLASPALPTTDTGYDNVAASLSGLSDQG